MKDLKQEDLVRLAKMAIVHSQQEGSPKGVLEVNKDYLKLYDNFEIVIAENDDHSFKLTTKMK